MTSCKLLNSPPPNTDQKVFIARYPNRQKFTVVENGVNY